MVGKISSQGGHNVTNLGLRELLSNNENFSIIELKKNIPHSFLVKKSFKKLQHKYLSFKIYLLII